jgi:2-methylcitrate dehydratase PrpD
MPHALVAAIIDEPISIRTFTDDGVARPIVREVHARVQVEESPACTIRDPDYQARSYGTRGHVEVEAWTRDGRHARREIDIARGHPSRELNWAEIELKFRDCAGYARLTAAQTETAFAALRTLSQQRSVATVVDNMRRRRPRRRHRPAMQRPRARRVRAHKA